MLTDETMASHYRDQDDSDNDSIGEGTIYDQTHQDFENQHYDDDAADDNSSGVNDSYMSSLPDDDNTLSLQTTNYSDGSQALDTTAATTSYHVRRADTAMALVHRLMEPDTPWKKGYRHRSGVLVEFMKGIDGDNIPAFRGTCVMQGFSPEQIFAVVGMRKLWDDWYQEGNLVENLNETTSLTYMTMKALPGIIKWV